MPASLRVGRRDARAPLALAIDVGTSSTRAAVFDALARPVSDASSRIPHQVAMDRHGAATLDPDLLVANVASCIDGALSRLGRRATDVAVVAASVFWHSLLGIDARGRPVTPLYTWADMRARDAARAMRSEMDEDSYRERTGCYLHSTYPAVKIRWLHDEHAAIFRRVARWISLAEYLTLRINGDAAASHGIAAATGLYEHASRTWDGPTLTALALDPARLSTISDAPISTLRAPFARRWPALARIPWLPGTGDGALANVGSGCAAADRAAISLGTSGAVRACYRDDRAVAPRGLWRYRLDEEHVVVGGAVNNGWNAIQWGARTWGDPDVGVDGDDGGLTFLPLFAGERTPWWADDATAAIAGLRLSTTPSQLAQALIASVVLRLAAAAQGLLDARPAIATLIASGGTFAWRPELTQVLADTLGRPVGLAADAEASARGAAILGLERIGALRSIETRPSVVRTFRPSAHMRSRYQDALERQARLHDALSSAGV